MGSLREELQKAVSEDKEETIDTNLEAKPAEPEEKPDIKPDETPDAEKPKDDPEKKPEEKPAEPEEKLTAPEHWAAKDKELFNKQPAEVQQWALDRHKAMEGDHTQKSQAASEATKRYEPIEQVMAPFRPWAQSQGLSDAQLMSQWANAHRALLSGNGKEMLLATAQQYGIDLTGEAQPVDPQIQELNTVVRNLQGQIQQTQQTFIGQQQSTMEQQLDVFAKQADDQGALLHPHFDTVMNDMVVLAQAERAQGRIPEIKDLYDKAVWMNPETREQNLAAQQTAAATKAQQEVAAKQKQDQERANKANLASASVSGDGSTAAPTQDGSIRSLLKDQFQTQDGRI